MAGVCAAVAGSAAASCGPPPRRAIQSALSNPGANSSSAAGAGADSTDLPLRRPASQSGTSSSSEAAWLRPESQSGKPPEESGPGVAWEAAGRLSSADGSARDSPAAGRFPSRRERSQEGSARFQVGGIFLGGSFAGVDGGFPGEFGFFQFGSISSWSALPRA